MAVSVDFSPIETAKINAGEQRASIQMQTNVVRQSIEALYQEAEAVVHDGTPMLAIIKSFPPKDGSAVTLSLVEDVNDKDNAAIESITNQEILHRISDLWAEAETIASQSDDDNESDDEIALPLTGAELDINLPEQPPVPTEIAGANQLNDSDLDQLVQDAKADIDAIAPLDQPSPGHATTGHDILADDGDDTGDIETVMADIAAAVGVSPEGPGEARSLDIADISEIPADKEAHKEPDLVIPMNAELASFIGDTVRSVLSEELPQMVRLALEDALGDMQLGNSADTTKAKASVKRKTTKTKKAAVKTANSKKSTAKAKTAPKAPPKAPPKAKTKKAAPKPSAS